MPAEDLLQATALIVLVLAFIALATWGAIITLRDTRAQRTRATGSLRVMVTYLDEADTLWLLLAVDHTNAAGISTTARPRITRDDLTDLTDLIDALQEARDARW